LSPVHNDLKLAVVKGTTLSNNSNSTLYYLPDIFNIKNTLDYLDIYNNI